MEDSEKQHIKKHFDNIYQIHLTKLGHVEIFCGEEIYQVILITSYLQYI